MFTTPKMASLPLGVLNSDYSFTLSGTVLAQPYEIKTFKEGNCQVKNESSYEVMSTGKRQLGPYPMERLKRVEQPTTRITGNIQRVDERESGFNRAARGDFGEEAAGRGRWRSDMRRSLVSAMTDVTAYLAPAVDGEVASSKAPIPEDPEVLSRHIKSLGYFLRADIISICRLPEYAVYSYDNDGNPIELNHQFAIVVVVDQDYTTINGSTGDDWISGSQSMRGYSNTTFIACAMANYIRRLGYPARAQCSGHYQVVIPPLLLLAGIGEICRAGIVLNPFLGTRFKAAAVTTDLPLLPDKPVDFGLQEFCQKCLKCATDCPVRAIPTGGTVMHNGYENWKLDVERCTKFRITNPHGVGCGRCIKVCPWNKPEGWTHDVVRWLIKHTPFLDKFIVKMDDIWGYGRQDKKDKWWFDLW